MLGERFVDADDQRRGLVHPCMQMAEDLSLQGFHEVGEDEVAAENQIEGPRRECATDVSMSEADAFAKLPPQAINAVRRLECATPPRLGQIF